MKCFGIGAAFVFLIVPASAWAADGDDVDDVAEAATTTPDVTREQVLQTIDSIRQTDPELAAEMERYLNEADGDFLSHPPADGQQPADGSGDPSRAINTLLHGEGDGLIGPPVEGEGTMPGQDPRFQEVQSDPRMQELREQVESGQMNEGEARERMFEILRDHGIEPAEGREWEHEGPSEGFERAYEQMAPEAREQMERMYETMHEQEGTMSESPEHEYEAPQHEYETPTHEYTAPEPIEHEYQMPEPGSEPDYPNSPPQP